MRLADRFSRRRPAAAAMGLVLLAGCRAELPPERLPTTQPADVSAERRELARRAALVHTVAGSGTLDLTRPDGDGVVLDVAVAIAAPDRARVRAYKMGRAVFDLTVTPAGAFVETGEARGLAAGATARQVTDGLALLTGGFFGDPRTFGRHVGDELVLRRQNVVCHVERATLVPRRFDLLDDAGRARFTLTLSHYQPGGGAVWPRQIVADGEHGRAVVTLDDVDVNGPLPAAAFDPPATARRLP